MNNETTTARDLTPRQKRIAEDAACAVGLPPEKGVAIIRSWVRVKAEAAAARKRPAADRGE